MKLLNLLKSTQWRPVAGLLLAGLLGWFAAWFMLPSGHPVSNDSLGKTESRARQAAPGPLQAGGSAALQAEISSPNQTFEQLLQKQQKISEGAASSSTPQPQPGSSAAGAIASAPTNPLPRDARDAALSEKMKAMQALQATALADIQAVPPGDTKKMMAAMERFDAQMRAAGAPSIIDMDNLRKMLEASDRLQALNRQIVAEAEKGRNSDANKLKALSQEIQKVQQAMPLQIVKADVLQKLTAK